MAKEKVVMIGKNDTWGVMLSWKKILGDRMEYFMSHPAAGYEDLSTPNRLLDDSLENADVIFLHVSDRDRGLEIKLSLQGYDMEKYKEKTIIYLCSEVGREKTIHTYKDLYAGYKGFVALTPDIATVLKIPYLPFPIDMMDKVCKEWSVGEDIGLWMLDRMGGQLEKDKDDIEDFIELNKYLEKKYTYNWKVKPFRNFDNLMSLHDARYVSMWYDNKRGCFSTDTLVACWSGMAVMSSLLPEYMPVHMKFTGTWTLPFINVSNLADLKIAIETLLGNPEFIKSELRRARRWMEKYWHRSRHLDNFNQVLKTLL